mmetsp:Transcript_22580/g.35847  ORF Transcript_22580/g.35847 Transcript_22580/m.35847 type:complete len:202 (-) Transcript_22580:45-650(-)
MPLRAQQCPLFLMPASVWLASLFVYPPSPPLVQAPTQACLNTTLRQYADVDVPSMCGPLPCTRASFSDDRIFLAPSMRRLLQAVMDCAHCSRAVGRTPNPHKLEFTLVSLQAGSPTLMLTDVPGMDTRTQPHAGLRGHHDPAQPSFSPHSTAPLAVRIGCSGSFVWWCADAAAGKWMLPLETHSRCVSCSPKGLFFHRGTL